MQERIHCWLLLILFVPAVASTNETDWYRAGVKAFQAKQFEDALRYFQKAQGKGMDTPNLNYNLGACYYKTGCYAKSAVQFQKLVNHPEWKALALYNLGLIAEAGGDREAALNYYTGASDAAAPSSRIHLRAALKRREMDPAADAGGHRWRGLLSMAVGYDDNAVMAPESALNRVSKQSDVFADLYAFGGRRLRGDDTDGVRIDAAAYARLYSTERDFNYGMLFAGAGWDKRYEKWRIGIGIGACADFVKDEFYAVSPQGQLVLDRMMNRHRFRFANTLNWVEAGNAYRHLAGVRNRTLAEIRGPLGNGRISWGYEAEYNDRQDLEAEDVFFSYSPFRHKVYAGIDYPVTGQWRVNLRGEFRRSIYSDANRQSAADGTIERYRREDDRLVLFLQGEYRVVGRFDIFAEYRLVDNNSNNAYHAYTTHQILLGRRKAF